MTVPRALDRVGIVVHPRRDLDEPLAAVRAWAARSDTEVVQVMMAGIDRVVAQPRSAESCDLIVAMGGDGTTLAALHAAAAAGKPVLGVACGSIGALTATAADGVGGVLDAFAAGEWRPRRLPGIAVSAGDAAPVVALNDFVVVRNGASQIVVEITVDGERFIRFAGDGIVIATPLGSSAYTIAAGGPMLTPSTDSIVLTPLAPHGGSCPPLVVASTSELTVSIEPGYYGARVELDGHIQELVPPTLSMHWRPDYATLVTFAGGESMLAGLRRRQILADSPRVVARDEREQALDKPEPPDVRSSSLD